MLWVYFIIVGLILAFGGVVLFGPPYAPTLESKRVEALKLLGLESGQTLLELGSGDGSMILAAAQQGLKVVAYELNPLLVLVSLWRTRKYREQVRIIWGNYWAHVWPRTDGIYVFSLARFMKKLDKKIVQNYPEQTVKVVSYAGKFPGRKITAEKKGLYLYTYTPNKSLPSSLG